MEDITFSLFKGYADTLPAEATLSEIIRMIRQDPTVKLHTLKHLTTLRREMPLLPIRRNLPAPAFP